MTPRTVLPRIALGLAIAGATIWLVFNRDRLDPAQMEIWIRALGPWAPLAHIALFALGTIFFVPGALFGFAGGVLFGPLWGTLYNLAGATLGATGAFLVARYLVAGWVREKAGSRLGKLIAGVEAEGWRFVAFTRLVPLFPFNFLNYALGLTQIPLTHYVLASLVCMAPGTLAFTWLAYAGREALAGNDTAIRYGLAALALLAAIAFLPRMIRRIRTAGAGSGTAMAEVSWLEPSDLDDALAQGPKPAILDVRGPDEFTGPLGHIATARNLPVGELADRLREIDALKDKPVILVCRTEKRSAAVSAVLQNAGFKDVHVLRGGMERWNQERRPRAV